MGKKFLGLGGTDHFWDRAKAWILSQITSAVAAKIAEVVANAPEDLDTLKEIADWIKNHANDAAAMNTQINTNKSNIATNTSDITALKTSVAGKADKVHTHSASDITSGTLPIVNGGTGATDAAGGFNTLADGVRDSSTPRDDEKMLLKPSGMWYKTTCLDFWNYIKGKIKSKTVTVGNITIPSDNYLEIDVGLTSSDTVISAKLSSWSSNTGAFSIVCYAKNRVFIVGDAGTTIVNVSVQAIYI